MKTLLKTGVITLLTFATFLLSTTNVNAQSKKSETDKTFVLLLVPKQQKQICHLV